MKKAKQYTLLQFFAVICCLMSFYSVGSPAESAQIVVSLRAGLLKTRMLEHCNAKSVICIYYRDFVWSLTSDQVMVDFLKIDKKCYHSTKYATNVSFAI